MPRRGPTYEESAAREAIAKSRSFTEALRRLGLCPTGGAGRVLRKWAAIWGISVDHFDPHAARNRGLKRVERRPLEEILVVDSSYCRTNLKQRLYEEGLKDPRCELCGQGEVWRGRTLSLILDHINGVSDDNRLGNLRILCPNCAATLDTHCGRKLRLVATECALCGKEFRPKNSKQRYCSRECGQRWVRTNRPRAA
jgi:hypothetical protein